MRLGHASPPTGRGVCMTVRRLSPFPHFFGAELNAYNTTTVKLGPSHVVTYSNFRPISKPTITSFYFADIRYYSHDSRSSGRSEGFRIFFSDILCIS